MMLTFRMCDGMKGASGPVECGRPGSYLEDESGAAEFKDIGRKK